MRRSSLLTVTAATVALSFTGAVATAAPAKKIVLADKVTSVGHPLAGAAAVVKLSASVPTGNKLTKYTVNWGDHSKTVSGKKLPKSLSHKYSLPGTYTVVFTVTDSAHRSVKTQHKITIGAVNLLVNGAAEVGAASPDSDTIDPPTGWATSGQFTAIQYGASGGFPDSAASKVISGGGAFFGGGNTDVSTATQNVDISAKASAVDAGKEVASLSGDLGGYASQSDNATVTASFVGATGAVLGAVGIGPVTETDRSGNTELLPRAAGAHLPAGTRTIQVVITSTRTDGEYDDGYADNLSLSLAP